MIFFTTFVTLIRPQPERAQRRLGSPARVEGDTLRLPIRTEVQIGDYVEHCPPNGEPRIMTVIDVIHPHMSAATFSDDHIEVTCASHRRVEPPKVTTPTLHPAMSAALALVEDGRMSEAILEALQVVEEQVQLLTARDDSGRALMDSVFGGRHRNSTSPRYPAQRPKMSARVSGSCSAALCSGYEIRTVPMERFLPQRTRLWSTWRWRAC